MNNRYFECQECGQVVQGFNASQRVDCCENPRYVEIYGPRMPELQADLADAFEALKPSLLTKWGNYRRYT